MREAVTHFPARPRLRGAALVAALALLTFVLPAGARQPAQSDGPPSLIVLLVVDQMRRDYINDYGSRWKKGLRTLVDEGAWFERARYPYLTTLTCAGHASIATGTSPSAHGIVSNQWWDREAQQPVSCTSDASAREVPYGSDRKPGIGGSPAALQRPTFASAIADARKGSRIVSISLKRAATMMMAGARADAAVWFQGGGFSSSSVYGTTPERSLSRYVEGNPIEREFGREWSRRGRSSDYVGQDDAPGEKPPREWTATFPHLLQPRSGQPTVFFYEAWQESPFSDEYLAKLAEEALRGMKLGQGPGTDILAVSFSTLDIVGHDFGPKSHEVQDVLRHLDEWIGRLLQQLDRRVGRERYVLAFTADHGVATIPEQSVAAGADGGRIKMDQVLAITNDTLSKKWGPGRWVATQAYTELYFRHGVFDRLVTDPELLKEVTSAIAAVPGVAMVLDSRDLAAGKADGPLARAAAASFFPSRSGDLIVIPKPNWIYVSDDKSVIPGNATTHGSPYDYDTEVPLILFGGRIKAGRYQTDATPLDIAPTLAHLAGVAFPTATGKILQEALSVESSPSTPNAQSPTPGSISAHP